MAEIVKKVDLIATFDTLKEIGDKVEIRLLDATESNVRAAAWRYSRRKNIGLVVTVTAGDEKIKVVRGS